MYAKEGIVIKKFFQRFYIEIICTSIGIGLTVASCFADKEFSTAQIILINITIATDVICLKIREALSEETKEIAETLKGVENIGDLYKYYHKIPEQWKRIAKVRLQEMISVFKAMSEGEMLVEREELINYQAKLLKDAEKKVMAIHRTLALEDIKRWDIKETTKDFSIKLINANRKIKSRVEKKRIFILDMVLLDDPVNLALWNKVLQEQITELKFDIRILTKAMCESAKKSIPPDMLLSDKEVITVHFFDERVQGKVNCNPEVLDKEESVFIDYWESGLTVDQFDVMLKNRNK